MPTQAVFSNAYYDHFGMFLKGLTSEKLPNGILNLEITFPSQFWQSRSTHAMVDSNGTIGTLPFSFFDDLKRYFTLSQDQNLIAVNRRLKLLEREIQNPLSPELQAFRRELHDKKEAGSIFFKHNLTALNACFAQGNEKSFWTTTLLKSLNCFRKLFNLAPLEFYSYDPINLQLFANNVVGPAMELTIEERTRSRFYTSIENNSPFTLPPELNREALQKLEYGLLHQISFEIDGKAFVIHYDKTQAEFLLSYTRNSSDSSPNLTQLCEEHKNYTYSSNPLNVLEKNIADGGTRLSYALQYFRSYSCENNFWSFSRHTHSYSFRPATMALKANREYTIPLSQGNLCLKLYRAPGRR